MSTTSILPSTFHAPAARASLEALATVRAAVLEDPRLISMLDAFASLALLLDEHRQIVHCNAAALRAVGVPHVDAILGQRPGEAVCCRSAGVTPGGCGTAPACRHCGAVNAILGALDGAAANGECHLLLDTPAGPAALELAVTATPVWIAGQRLVLLTGTEIGASKRRAALERIFFHDVLNLAGSIQAIAHLLVEAMPGEKPVFQARFDLLVDNLIEQIRAQRDLSTAESGELVPAPVSCSAARLLADLQAAYEHHPVAAGRLLRCAAPLPADLTLVTDPTLLGRALGNLIKNALEASTDGQAVTVACERAPGDRVRFTVHNATAMPPDVQSRVFHRSFTTKGETGRGLGTFSVKLLVERYLGGRVDFLSEPGVGTTFTVEIPRNSGRAVEAPAHAGDAPPLSMDGLRVLIVDDDPDMRRIIDAIVRRAGARTTLAADGPSAIERLGDAMSGSVFDAILLDMDVAGTDGCRIAEIARRRGVTAPIIAVSAHGSGRQRDRCRLAGCNDYLEKPFKPEALLAALRRHVRVRPAPDAG